LGVPEAIDFGRVLIGSSATREFSIENLGGGLVEGTAEAQAPWRIDGEKKYRLAHGAKQNFTIKFDPRDEQEFRGTIRYSSHADRATSLHAIAATPIAVTPQTLGLSESNAGRSGVFQIENRADEK